LAYYGGLGSRHNQEAALRCHAAIMPRVWQQFPQAELWLVGSNPSPALQALQADPRVKVTGYVEKVQDVLRTMTAVLCPWQGTYGFRSRLIEVMALGVPVVATPDAACGMELVAGAGFLSGTDDAALTHHAITLMRDRIYAGLQSEGARQQVEQLYGMPKTYGRLVDEMERWLSARPGASSSPERMRAQG
jgi:glycosyltransferase involved in cell wall biosynthesis